MVEVCDYNHPCLTILKDVKNMEKYSIAHKNYSSISV